MFSPLRYEKTIDLTFMEILIRHAENKDLSHIQKLMTELNDFQIKNFSNQNKPFHKRTKEYPKIKKEDIKNNIILVAEIDNNIIGYIWGSIHKRKAHELSIMGYIDEICVNQKYRTKGVGKRLLKLLETKFRQKKCDHMVTHTDYDNEIAQKSYSNYGMLPVTIEYWKEIEK